MPCLKQVSYPHQTTIKTYNETSRQIGDIKTDVYEEIETPAEIKSKGANPEIKGKPVVTYKTVKSYYVDKYGTPLNNRAKQSVYYYNMDGSLKRAQIERTKAGYEVTQAREENGKWYNRNVKTGYLDVTSNADGKITKSYLNTEYLDKTNLDSLPAKIQKTMQAGLDDIVLKLTKLR